jgi:hypothetical protein
VTIEEILLELLTILGQRGVLPRPELEDAVKRLAVAASKL